MRTNRHNRQAKKIHSLSYAIGPYVRKKWKKMTSASYVLQCCLYFYSFSFSFFSFFFLFVHERNSFTLSITSCANVWLSVYVRATQSTGAYIRYKAAEARGPHPAFGQSPTILALPRSPALGVTYFFPSSILPPSLHHQSRRHRHLLRRVHYLFSLLLLAVSPSSDSLPLTVEICSGSGLRDSFITPCDWLAIPTQSTPTTRT